MIRFIWTVHFKCNYRCPYCNFNGKWAELSKQNVYFPKEQWYGAWDRIYQKYGSVEILFSGGEPCIYPSFIKLARKLSKKHYLGLTTNLSIDFSKFADIIDPQRLKFGIGASFHPPYADFDQFVNKVLMLKEKNFRVWVNYVAYPLQLEQMEYFKNKFSEYGLHFVVQPYRGMYQGCQYPHSYTEEQREFIKKIAGNAENVVKDMEYQLEEKKTKGKLCRAGQVLAHIEPGGKVKRCGQTEQYIGNIFDKNFKLLDRPLPCPVEHCPCDYIYLVEEEDRGGQFDKLEIKESKQFQPVKGECYKKTESIKVIPPNKLRVALVLTPGWGREAPPYSLALLAGILRSRGFEVSVFDINNLFYHKCSDKHRQVWNWEESSFWQNQELVSGYIAENDDLIDSVTDKILSSQPDVIGFTIYTTTKYMSLELANRIKRRNNKKIVIFGGTECQRKNNWEELLDKEFVDAVMLGEADESFPEFLETINKNGEFGPCPGVVYKKDGQVIDCGDPRPVNLENLPFADFSDFNFNTYEYPDNIKIAFSRGCTEKCVYCSAREVWSKFRTMSGERIFNEIIYQVENYHNHMGEGNSVHIMFLDSLVNGNMEVFRTWIDKLVEAREDKDSPLKNFSWGAQIIIRPQMTLELLQKVKQAGCIELNYGIESGSLKVLKDMGKRYTPSIAEEVIRNIYKAGLPAKGNFMIGFPTETEEDFQHSLDFVKRNAKFMKQIYPSRTFCALEKFSYLTQHKEEFGILPHCSHHLFWESDNGRNNYLTRLDRYIRFCKLATSFPHKPLLTGVEDIERDKFFSLGNYYRFKKDYRKALLNYKRYLASGGAEKSVSNYINFCEMKIDDLESKNKVKPNLKNQSLNIEQKLNLQLENLKVNQEEYDSGCSILNSTPPNLFLQIDGPCNQECIFCSRPKQYKFFNLDEWIRNFERKFAPIINRAQRLHLTGAGELLLLPESQHVLRYFDNNFPQVEKVFATNGSVLEPKFVDLIMEAESRYTIQVSLHTINPQIHHRLTQADNFSKIIANLEYLVNKQKNTDKVQVYLMFLLTTINIKNLPKFIKFGSKLGIDRVICEYNSVYNINQKPLSCFFQKDITNKMLAKAEKLSKRLNIDVQLPFKFGQNNYPPVSKCREPWSSVMINFKGEILPCCFFDSFNENLNHKQFMDIWNNKIYQDMRKFLSHRDILGSKTNLFCKKCYRYKPDLVNNFESHIITRGKSEPEMEELLTIE